MTRATRSSQRVLVSTAVHHPLPLSPSQQVEFCPGTAAIVSPPLAFARTHRFRHLHPRAHTHRFLTRARTHRFRCPSTRWWRRRSSSRSFTHTHTQSDMHTHLHPQTDRNPSTYICDTAIHLYMVKQVIDTHRRPYRHAYLHIPRHTEIPVYIHTWSSRRRRQVPRWRLQWRRRQGGVVVVVVMQSESSRRVKIKRTGAGRDGDEACASTGLLRLRDSGRVRWS